MKQQSKPWTSLEMFVLPWIASPRYWKRTSECRSQMCLLQDDHSSMHSQLPNVSLLIPYLTHVSHARLAYITRLFRAELRIDVQLCARQNLCEKQRTNPITCWQGAKPFILERFISVMAMWVLWAERPQRTVSEICSVVCSRHVHATLLQSAGLLQRAPAGGTRRLNSGTSLCLTLAESKANLMTVKQSRR